MVPKTGKMTHYVSLNNLTLEFKKRLPFYQKIKGKDQIGKIFDYLKIQRSLTLAWKSLQSISLKIYWTKIEALKEEILKEPNETLNQIYELEAFKRVLY